VGGCTDPQRCTGFTNSEEEAVQLTSAVPFLIETKFKELGGVYSTAADWNPHVVVDKVAGGGTLITGQNPQSSDAAAAATLEALK
jgi:putative intracellular protease/amidase